MSFSNFFLLDFNLFFSLLILLCIRGTIILRERRRKEEKKNRCCMIFRCACISPSVVVSRPEDDEET